MWCVACASEKRVQVDSLDVTVEVSGACAQPSCRVEVLDDVRLSGPSFQLSTAGPEGELTAFGCGAFDAPSPVATLEVRLRQIDGGTRFTPLAIGAAWPAFKPNRQVGFGFYFDLTFDGGVEAIDPEITLVEQAAGMVTMRYAAPERLDLVDGGSVTMPGLEVIETFRYERGTRPVDFVYEPICAPDRSPGVY